MARVWCAVGAYNPTVAPKLRKLSPDPALFRRRAAGEPLREIAAGYGVSHTSLSRYFARPEAAKELRRAEQLNRAEQRAEDARWRDEQRAVEERWRAERKAEREARRKAKEHQAAEERRAAGQAPAAPSPSERASVAKTARSRDGSARSSSARPLASRRRVGLAKRTRASDPHQAWLDTRKNLSGRALAKASGLVRLSNPEGTFAGWVEAAEAPALLEAGWTPA